MSEGALTKTIWRDADSTMEVGLYEEVALVIHDASCDGEHVYDTVLPPQAVRALKNFFRRQAVKDVLSR